MIEIFNKIYDIWNKHGFVILLIFAVISFLIYYFFYSDKNTGSYNTDFFYDPLFINKNNNLSEKFNNLKPSPQYKRSKPRTPPKMSKGESICKAYLQRRFNKPFTNQRPKYMFNSVTGKALELDCYNEELRLAVEYNGKQHYEYVKFFHKSRADFQNQCYRDKIKQENCKKVGIILIEVPYTVQHEDIPNFLEDSLKKTRILIIIYNIYYNL